MAVFSCLVVFLLHKAGVWELQNLKTTILWFLGVSIPWAVDFKRLERDPNDVARRSLVEAGGVAAIVSFATNSFTFPLWVELLLVPAAGLLTIVSSGKSTPDTAVVSRAARTLLIALGYCVLGWAILSAIGNPRAFFTWDNARDFSDPLLLSLFLTAFMYVLNVRIAYHLAFIVMGRDLGERPGLRRYAKWLAIRSFGLNFVMLRRWKGYLLRSEVKSKHDLLETVSSVKASRARERHPPNISPEEGWSPYSAMGFLAEVNLQARNYGLSYLGQWKGSAPYKWVGEYLAGNHLEFNVIGTDIVATKLELVLDVRDVTNSELLQASFLAFVEARRLLLAKVFGEDASQIDERLASNKRARTTLGDLVVTLTADTWAAQGYELTLAITHSGHVDPLRAHGRHATTPNQLNALPATVAP
jgi:hypothetical protein